MPAGTATVADREAAAQAISDLHAEYDRAYSTDLGQAALKDLQQTFPHHWLYVGELLQNAVDAGATRIRLVAVPEGCLFEHDGAPFEAKHVRALCARGLSTKGAGTVGFMGIGFKAVFQSFERAAVSSGSWRFGFCVKEEVGDEYGERLRDWLGCVLPVHVDIGDPSPGMRCRFLLTDRVAGIGSVRDDVAHVLSADLEVLALLAQRGVEELVWNDQRWLLSKTEYRLDDQTSRLLLEALDERSGEVRQWVLLSTTYQPSRQAIARFLEHRQIRPRPEAREKVYAEASRQRTVDVFCPIDADGVPVPPKRGSAYALLASGVSVPLGLHVQADWLLNTSRRELMDVETNAWHQEIFARLPGLLCSYLSWVCTIPNVNEARLAGALGVLPGWGAPDGTLGDVVHSEAFKAALRAGLYEIAFLPVRTAEGVGFVSPQHGRLLPGGLRGFDTAALRPWVLFGDEIISTYLLGERTFSSLDHLKLLQEITPDSLVTRWTSGVVGVWRGGAGEAARDVHARLLRSLAALDGEASWRDASLCCLPSTSGAWIPRQAAVGLPGNWGFVPEPIGAWLESCLPDRAVRLDWEFDRSVQRDTGVQSYVESVKRESLDLVFSNWWASLDRTFSEEDRAHVLAVTSWVHTKQKQQPGLVKRILCVEGDSIVLVPFEGAVLAEPYARKARRYFYPAALPVSECYLQSEPGSSEASWRSFFEEASDNLRGPLRLSRSVRELSSYELRKALPGYSPPATKTVPIRVTADGVRFSSDNYVVVDTSLPDELARRLASIVSRETSLAVGSWLDEARQVLVANPKIRVSYVPYYSSYVTRSVTEFSSSWVPALQNATWLYGTDESGPHTPAQVLARPDPARPDAVVAELPAELVTTLQDCGVLFGSDVPDVLSVERLRREGPAASVERISELLEAAIAETEADAPARDELVAVLRAHALIAIPSSVELIDGVSRITADRLVSRSGRGADLGGWIVSTETTLKDLGGQGAFADVIRLVMSVIEVPETPTGTQALAFLEWVWQSRPEAEAVRRTLPRLYRLVLEDVQSGTLQPATFVARAMVYVASRRWVSVGADDLFLDDLGEDRLKSLVGGLLLATPGHLGETADEQRRVAALLGIKPLSTRLTLHLQSEDEQPLPDGWLECIHGIVELASAFAHDEEDTASAVQLPEVHYYARLQKSLMDKGCVTQAWEVRAARDGAHILVSGEPREFMADLCRVLLQWAGLSGRRDLDDLAPTITQLIVYLGSPEAFAERLQDVRVQHGMIPPPRTPASPTLAAPPADGSTQNPPTPTSPTPSGTNASPKPTPTGMTSQGGAGEPINDDNDGAQKPSAPTSDESPAEPTSAPGPSGGWTADDRERRLESVRKQRNDAIAKFDAKERELWGTGPLPPEDPNQPEDDRSTKELASDVAYRQAAIDFEREQGRYAEAKDAKQPGFDIDSYDKPPQDPARLLVRRIEVKGCGCPWNEDQAVALSDRQFLDALARRAEDVRVATAFDYWLYVVERQTDGKLHVLPIKNPSRHAAKFEFRAGTWRALAESDNTSAIGDVEHDE